MTKKPKNKKTKVHLVFDEGKRREFLTGFHKRKLERKKKAQEELEKQLKEERKRLKAETKDMYKNMTVSHRPIPELENLLKEEYEDENVNVKVLELSSNAMTIEGNTIGANKMKVEGSEEENESEAEEEVPGMELKQNKKQISKPKEEFRSERQFKKEIRRQAAKKVQKSKVFQRKNKLEQQKQKKKSLQQKRLRIKEQNKKTKLKHKNKSK